jgi:hypothetical protein
VRDAVGLNGFSDVDDQPIEIIPDLTDADAPPPAEAKASKKGA